MLTEVKSLEIEKVKFVSIVYSGWGEVERDSSVQQTRCQCPTLTVHEREDCVIMLEQLCTRDYFLPWGAEEDCWPGIGVSGRVASDIANNFLLLASWLCLPPISDTCCWRSHTSCWCCLSRLPLQTHRRLFSLHPLGPHPSWSPNIAVSGPLAHSSSPPLGVSLPRSVSLSPVSMSPSLTLTSKHVTHYC